MSDGPRPDADVLRILASISANISRGRPLDETLRVVAEAVVDGVGFGAAVVNFVLPGGDLKIAAVAGPAAMEQLLGEIAPRVAIDDMLVRAEPWGALRYVPHGQPAVGENYQWVPDVAAPDAPDAWHPDDSLLVPLYGSEGSMVGVLSVDLPPGQRRPTQRLCDLLEMFAVQAGIAIDNARLMEALRQERDRLAASEAAYRFFFTGAAGAMATVGLQPDQLGVLLRVNDAFAQLFGYGRADLEGRNWLELVAEEERPATLASLATWREGRSERRESRMVRHDGSAMWVALQGTAITPGEQRKPEVLVHVDDITERKHQETELVAQANADPLTGLPNRRALLRYLTATLAQQRDGAPVVAVIYADLNDFKPVNDQFGHATGDEVLCEAAARLVSQVRAGDVVARLGGDEFAIVATDLGHHKADELVDRIHRAFAEPMGAAPDRQRITVSLGVVDSCRLDASAPPASRAKTLLNDADLAMFAAKILDRARP